MFDFEEYYSIACS